MLHDDDIFQDLVAAAERAKTAAAVAVEGRPKRLYRGDIVEVLKEDPAARRSRWFVTPEGGDEWDGRWVGEDDLRPVPASMGGKIHVERTMEGGAADLAAWCESVGYELGVMMTGNTKGGIDPYLEVQEEYLKWTDGETLPDEAIIDHIGAGHGNNPREWTIKTLYSDKMPCKGYIDIVGAGTVGSGPRERRGIHGGRFVTFQYVETVRDLVMAGLRAGKHWR